METVNEFEATAIITIVCVGLPLVFFLVAFIYKQRSMNKKDIIVKELIESNRSNGKHENYGKEKNKEA